MQTQRNLPLYPTILPTEHKTRLRSKYCPYESWKLWNQDVIMFPRKSSQDLISCHVDPVQESHMQWEDTSIPLEERKPAARPRGRLALSSVAGLSSSCPDRTHEEQQPARMPSSSYVTPSSARMERGDDASLAQEDSVGYENEMKGVEDVFSCMNISGDTQLQCFICENEMITFTECGDVYCHVCESLSPIEVAFQVPGA